MKRLLTASSWRHVGLSAFALAALALVLVLASAAFARPAVADDAPSRPSVLVVEAGLGDYDLCALHWLGEDAQLVAAESGLTLATAANPAWWSAGAGTGSAPATFLLGCDATSAVTADSIIWALDQIRATGAEPRTFVVAMGATGLPLREYAEDLASQKQSARADIVGLGFCGTPQLGYSALPEYPESALWAKAAAAIGRSADDLAPGSAYIQALNGAQFPRVCKTLSVYGSVGDLGFGLTDGMGVQEDFAVLADVSDQVVPVQVTATISQAANLTGSWEPFTSAIDYPQRNVDAPLTDRLSAMSCYETSSEVQSRVREFYESWFGDRVPVTHNSNVLALDLSGSMMDRLASGEDKLTAAKLAAKDYLQAMQAMDSLPQSAPMDASLFGFGETTSSIADSYDAAAIAAIDRMQARGETDIGLALDRAMATLRTSPTCAYKHVLLLSDGASTQGQTEAQMFAGPIAEAQREGIVIDAIGFGDVGESNAGFLQRVADATGGTYYQATDTYGLKVNFLKAYYSSLGLNLVDEELDESASIAEAIGTVDERTSALQIGVVADGDLPQVELVCEGESIDLSSYAVQEANGLLSLQCVNPPMGEYSLRVSGGSGPKHVFAVKQQGIWRGDLVVGEQRDYALYLLVGAGVLLVAALVATVIFTTRRRPASGVATGAPTQGPANSGRSDS